MKKLFLLIFTFMLLFIIGACTSSENPDPDYCSAGNVEGVYLCKKSYSSYFDTSIDITFYVTHDNSINITQLYEYIDNVLNQYHQLFDKYHEYSGVVNVYSINHREDDSVLLSPELFDAIAFALEHEQDITVESVPLFNIALGPVLSIWHNARESALCDSTVSYSYDVCPVPSDLIDNVTFPTDPNDIVLDESYHTMTFLKPGMEIDLGGFGKGYVSEIITDYLDQMNVSYILNAGNSNVKAGGINPNNSDGLYYIALTKPDIENAFYSTYFAYIKVPGDMAVVTSGNYQRFFIGLEDGLVYHHIIDPRTNYPGGEAMSVTLLYEDGAIADIYSTAIYLMTVEEGLLFVNNTSGLEAIWYLQDGSVVQSDGFGGFLYQLLP